MFLFVILMAASFFVAGLCQNEEKPRSVVFARAFAIEFILAASTGALMVMNGIGYFSGQEADVWTAVQVLCGATFLGVLIGAKAAYPHIN